MPFFLDLLDKIGKKQSTQNERSLNSSRVIGVGDNAIALRLPDNSAKAQFASRAFRNLGNENTVGVDTNPTILNLNGLMEKQADGRVKIDFTSMGGEVFLGTQAELADLSGDKLLKKIGNAAFQNSAGGTLDIGGKPLPNIIGGQSSTKKMATADLSTQALSDDVKSISDLISGLENIQIPEKLNAKFLEFDEEESDAFIKLFRNVVGESK